MFVTEENLRGLAFGPVYTKPGEGGRIDPFGTTVASDKAGRSPELLGLGNSDVNPMPFHTVMADNMRGMGALKRFARVPKWGGDLVDLDRRPLVETGTTMSGIMDMVKSYALPIGLGLGAAVVLAFVLKSKRRRKNPCRSRSMRRSRRTRRYRR